MEVKFKLLVFNVSRNSSLVREPGIPSFPLVGLAPLPRVQLLSSRGMGRFIIKYKICFSFPREVYSFNPRLL